MEKVDQEGKPLELAGFNLYDEKYDPEKSEEDNAKHKINKELLVSTKEAGKADARALIYKDGIKAGTYYLVEKQTPDGYNSLPGPVKISVKENETSHIMEVAATIKGKLVPTELLSKDLTTGVWTLKVMNESGYELPSTGGSGTHLFYLLGAMLTILSGVILLARRASMQGNPS